MNRYLSTILESSEISEEDYNLLNPDTLYDGITEEVSIPTTPEMARVIRISENEYAITLNELSEVTKYLSESDSDCDEYEALEKVAETNKLKLEEMVVVVPSKESFEAFIEACNKEASGCNTESGKAKAKSKVKCVKEKIGKLKDKCVKIKKQKC